MRQDHRTPFERALLRTRASAYAPGEFAGQESFMTAGEIRALAVRAGIGPGAAVLDVGCGTGGPGRFLTRELGCDYLGVDFSASAVALAREYAAGLPCRYAVAHAPPLPAGPFDAVLLLEAMLAVEDKEPLIRAVAAALRPGGRFALTLEEGTPLTAAERAAMPDPDTVWLSPIDAVTASLERAGLVVTSLEDHSPEHRAMAQALTDAYAADAAAISAQIGRRALDDILAAHRLWVEWLDSGRVRKLALVAELSASAPGSARHAAARPAASGRPAATARRAARPRGRARASRAAARATAARRRSPPTGRRRAPRARGPRPS
jgi:SAM-dependent methyltransferase